MQGASILAAGKVYENDIGRNASSLPAGVANSKGFTDCLRKQNQHINSSPGDAAAATEPAGSRPAKLDRSALLRAPVAKNSRAANNTANDVPGCETMLTDADKTGTLLVADCSPAQAQPQAKADAAPTTEPAAVEQQVMKAVAENLTGTGSTLAVEVVKSPGSQTVQPTVEQDATDSSADTADLVKTAVNSNAAPELQSRDNLIQITQGVVTAVDNSEKPKTEASQPQVNQNVLPPESTELSGQVNAVPVGGKTANPAEATVATVEIKSPDSTPPAAIEKVQPSENLLPLDGQTKKSITEAGTDVPAQMAPKPEAEKVSTRVEADSVSQRLAADPAPLQQDANSPELLSQVSNTAAPVAVQPVADQTASTEAPEAASGSAMPLEEAVIAVASQPSKPSQAAKGEAKANGSEAKAEAAGAKNALEVAKAMAGKLEETAANSSVQADKKENTGSGELKKLMEFESNRLQAVPLKDTASGTGNSGSADKQAMITATLLPQTAAISDMNQTQVTKLSDQAPVDVKTLIDQVVQKAELTVKANSSEMKIQLEPEFLGKLTIKIALEDGLLTARFTTENHQVKHLLESNLVNLRQSLEAQGIKVEKTEVNVQLDSGGTFGGYEEGRQEMWQRPETPNYRNSSYAAGGYELNGEAELMESAFSPSEYYGIQADGSMNYLV